ncbi:MAG: GntR family transcriptional regulator [Spirochaetales bacterium]|nr:GntR family transcriptional regulator [Spirochaetales bacterium]
MINILISNSSEKPLYRQIIDQIRISIMDGDILPGQSLPSIRTLAADLSISVITTKRAYDELEAEGLLEIVPGKGCFAAGDNKMLRERRLKILEEQISDLLKQSEYLEMPLEELLSMIRVLKEEGIGTNSSNK